MKLKTIVVGTTAILASVSTTAFAERSMVILLDATGSMQAIRPDNGLTRYENAKNEAVTRMRFVAMQTAGLEKVAVYQFYGAETALRLTGTSDADPWTTDIDAAELAILSSAVSFEVTPLAGAMCAAVDRARSSVVGTIPPVTRFLEVFTDGGENATNPLDPCYGPASVVLQTDPFDDGSWHQKVWQRTTNPLPAVTVATTLYTDVSMALMFNPFASLPPPPSESGATTGAAPAGFSIFSEPVSDLSFFSALSEATGGQFTLVGDSAPTPVIGDLDFDLDVDRDDAIALARAFGQPSSFEYDLDGNGSIGYGDYTRLLARFGTGTQPPSPDPYTQGSVVSCKGAQVVTIENKVIEAGGLTISGTGACSVVIKNSLIVSGGTAVRTTGVGSIRVDDSYIVGEGRWLESTGVFTLSAANTVFHGPRQTLGAFVYVDRGGNTFE